MKFPRTLYNPTQRIYEKVDFQVKGDNSGIDLKSFELDRKKYQVIEVESYRPWFWGETNPGAGQIGVYTLRDNMGNAYRAIIKDYRAAEGCWKIHLQELQKI